MPDEPQNMFTPWDLISANIAGACALVLHGNGTKNAQEQMLDVNSWPQNLICNVPNRT